MEFDLRAHLRDLSATPPVPPEAVPTAAVLARVHRGRALRTAGAAVASAAAVLAAGAVVYAAPWDGPTPPPADTPHPTTEAPEPTSTHEPSPEPTPIETATPAPPATPSPVALTASGELVELDPSTGDVVRQIAADADWSGPLAVDRERGYVYLTKSTDWDDPEWPGTVQRVSIADATVVDVAHGRSPALAPDGGTLAFVSEATIPDPHEADQAPIEVNTVTTLDLADGSTTSVVDPWPSWGARAVGEPVWSADGARIYLHVGWVDEPFGTQVLVLDPATDTVINEETMAVTPREPRQSWARPIVLPDGRLAVTVDARGPDVGTEPTDLPVEWETGGPNSVDTFAAVVDPVNGSVLEQLEVAGHDVDRIVAAARDGGGLAFVDWRSASGESSSVLHLVGPDGVVELGRSTWGPDGDGEEGIVAISW